MFDLEKYGLVKPACFDWATDRINGSDVTVGVVDSGIVIESHLEGRVTDIIRRDIGPGDIRNSGHGLLVASVIGGVCEHVGPGGFALGQGIAPQVSILNQYSISGSIFEFCQDTVRHQGRNGAYGSIQNNSWSIERENPPRYGDFEQQYDLAVRHASGDVTISEPLIIVFGSGNSGTVGLRRPTSAKNIITVGASWRQSGTHTLWEHSSIGDCHDGRIKPDLLAPTPISAAFPAHLDKKDNKQIDAGHRWFGGTSAAAAVASGGIALIVDGWSKNYKLRPTPSMVKAILVNDAEDLKIGGPAPNPFQGWGQIELNRYFRRNAEYVFFDRITLEEGRVFEVAYEALDDTVPVTMTLVWDDVPGEVGAARALVNRLSLEAFCRGQIYRGNVFENGVSIPSNRLDEVNNVWKLIMPSHQGHQGRIRVAPVELKEKARKDLFALNQDFSLVVHNARITELPSFARKIQEQQSAMLVLERRYET